MSTHVAGLRELRSAAGRLAAPAAVHEVELSAPLPGFDEPGAASTSVLVRLHRIPLGTVVLPGGSVGADALRAVVAAELGPVIRAHLADDGMDGAHSPSDDGVPPCGYERLFATEPAPSLTVVIPTRERPAKLARLLDSILAGTRRPLEILVVDNSPVTDDVTRLVDEHYAHRGVRRLVESSPGVSPTRNRGLAETLGETVAFVDDDVVVDRHWVAATLAALMSASDAGCVTALVRPSELTTPAQVWLEQYAGFDKGYRRRAFRWDDRDAGRLHPFAAGSIGTGASMAFWADVARRLGGFDPALGTGGPARGGEDLDVILRVMQAGLAVVYDPAVLVWHEHRRDEASLRRAVYGYGVGLGAYLAKTVATRGMARHMLRQVPAGAHHFLAPTSAKNAARTRGNYPRALAPLELIGLAYGPIAYARSRRALRR
jgi:GT2 family glycosyltransferase